LAYKVHPYQWATIGKEISHIEKATMGDVKDFFFQHYTPDNAILVVAGNVTFDQVKMLSEKWFGQIPKGKRPARKLPAEPLQSEKRTTTIEAKVPANALYKTYHMPGRFHDDFYTADLMSDILGRGHSSRLYNELVKEKEIFTSISSHPMGTVDPGLIIISGRLKDGISLQQGEEEVDRVISTFLKEGVNDIELNKVKAQAESTIEFDEIEVMNRAMNLAFAKLSGDASLVNKEGQKINAVSVEDISRVAKEILKDSNSSVMYYKAIN
jgi:zinc protease